MSALPCLGADLVVVAGDVLGSMEHLEFLERIDAPVLLVLGNKDYWRAPSETQLDPDDLVQEIRERLAGGNVTLLERDEAVIDGVRFLGGTMWTDVAGLRPLAASMGGAHNDGNNIVARKAWQRFAVHPGVEELMECESEPLAGLLRELAAAGAETGRLNPLLHAFLHLEFKEWLAPRLQQHFDGPTVIVTHHAPSRRSLPGVSEHVFRRLDSNDEWPRFSEDTYSVCVGAFGAVSDEWLLKSVGGKAALWVHGGSHREVDYALGGTRVVSNPLDRRPEFVNRGKGFQQPWLVDPCEGAAPALRELGVQTLEAVREQAGEFAEFAARVPKAGDDVVARALLESAQARASAVLKHHEQWVRGANEVVIGADALWPDRLDRVVPGFMGVSLANLWDVKADDLPVALDQMRDFERLLLACADLTPLRKRYLSRAADHVREKFLAAGYDFTLASNPEGHVLAPMWISVDVRRTPGLGGEGLVQLFESVDQELRDLGVELQAGEFEVAFRAGRSSALRVIDLRLLVDGDENFDEQDC